MSSTNRFAIACHNCQEKFDEEANPPRILTKCGQSICTKCLKDILATESSKNSFSFDCPLCKQSYSFLLSDVKSLSSFPKNFFLCDMSSTLKNDEHRLKQVVISPDDELYLCKVHGKPVTFLDKETREYACNDCLNGSAEIDNLIKLSDLKSQAYLRLNNFLSTFEKMEEGIINFDNKGLLHYLNSQKNNAIELLKVQYEAARSALAEGEQLMQAKILLAFEKVELACRNSGLTRERLSHQFHQDYVQLRQINSEFESEKHSLASLRSLQFVSQDPEVSMLISNPVGNFANELRSFVDLFNKSVERFVSSQIKLVGDPSNSFPPVELPACTPRALSLMHQDITLTTANQKGLVQALLIQMTLNDEITHLSFKSLDNGDLESKFRCDSQEAADLLSFLESPAVAALTIK